MAETAQDIVNRALREFKRYTGDGLPGEPVNAPLPVGDPQSGVWNPRKRHQREALLAPLVDLDASVAEAAGFAEDAGDAATRAETAAAGVEYPVSYGASQSLTEPQKQQARQNIGLDIMALQEVNLG